MTMLAKFLATAALTTIAAIISTPSNASDNVTLDYYMAGKGWAVNLARDLKEPKKSACYATVDSARDTPQMARNWDNASLYVSAVLIDNRPYYIPTFQFLYPNPSDAIKVRAKEQLPPALTIFFDNNVKKFSAVSDVVLQGSYNRKEGAELKYLIMDQDISDWFIQRLRKQVSSYVVSFDDAYGTSMSKFYVTGAKDALNALDECIADLPAVMEGRR